MIQILIKELNFNYTEILNMDIETFTAISKSYQENEKNRIETIKKIQKNNPQSFIFNLPL